MKDFGSWVNDMAGSIEDNSFVSSDHVGIEHGCDLYQQLIQDYVNDHCFVGGFGDYLEKHNRDCAPQGYVLQAPIIGVASPVTTTGPQVIVPPIGGTPHGIMRQDPDGGWKYIPYDELVEELV